MFASTIGNVLEFYDFALVGMMLTKISVVFFPQTGDHTMQLFLGFFAFGAAFAARPFGAMFFGFLGDRFGRRFSLSLSVILMSIPSLIIGLLPSYEDIGMFAPIILLVCRLFQGICVGGEYSGAAIFALEHAGKYRPGLIGSFLLISGTLGCLLATIAAVLTTYKGAPDFAWRIPFLIGSCVGFVGFFVRRKLAESPEFSSFIKKKSELSRITFRSILKNYSRQCFHTLATGLYASVKGYTHAVFMKVYLMHYLQLSYTTFIYTLSLSYLTYILGAFYSGMRADKRGISRTFSQALLVTLFFIPVVFYFIQLKTFSFVLVGMLLFGWLIGISGGAYHAHLQSLFPVEVRYRGIAISFSLGVCLGGGAIGLVNNWLMATTHNPFMPVLPIVFAGALCLLSFPYSRRRVTYATS